MNSAANPETLADIVREMRNDEFARSMAAITHTGAMHDMLCAIADRIEAAAWRAHDIAAALLAAKGVMYPHPDPDNAPPPTAGNAAAMREALEIIARKADKVDKIGMGYNDAVEISLDIQSVAEAALSAPPRNCDVGTADDQAERFVAECKRHDHCSTCPVHAMWGVWRVGQPKSCKFIWAQMPYEAEGGKE